MERKTLIARNTSAAPLVYPVQAGAPSGAFDTGRGLVGLGQGLSEAGQAGAQYAFRAQSIDQQRKAGEDRQSLRNAQHFDELRERFEVNQAKKLAVALKKEREVAQLGVWRNFQSAAAKGELPENLPAHIEQSMATMRSELLERTKDLRASEFYKRIASPDEDALDEERFKSRLYETAIVYDSKRSLEKLVLDYNDRATILLEGPLTDAGMVERVDRFVADVRDANLPVNEKEALQRKVEGALYAKLHSRITVDGARFPEETLKSLPRLSDERREDLILAQRRLGPQGMSKEDSTKVVDASVNVLLEGKSLSPAQQSDLRRAIESVPHAWKDPAAAKIQMEEFDQKLFAAQTFGALGHFASEKMSMEQLQELNTALLGNESARQYLRQREPKLDWAKLTDPVMDKYRVVAQKRTAAALEAFSSFQGTRVLDNTPDLAPLADEVTVAFNRAVSSATPEESAANIAATKAKFISYTDRLNQEYNARGIPSDQRPQIPETILSALDGAFLQEQGNSAIAQLYNLRAVFGREGTAAYVKRAMGSRNGPLRDKAHIGAFAAVQHYALWGAQNGEVDNTLMTSAKTLFDSISNLPEKKRQWGSVLSNYDEVTGKVFDSTYFRSNLTADKVLSGKAISDARSRMISFQGMAYALAWTFGEPALRGGFRDFVRAAIADDALRTAREAGDPAADMVSSGNRILDTLAQAITVVRTNAPENPDAIFAAIPTAQMAQEKWYQTPVRGGGGTVVEYSEDMTNTITAIFTNLYSRIDRSSIGNVVDFASLLRDGFSRHAETSVLSAIPINDSILKFPASLELPLENSNIVPNYAGPRSNETQFLHPSSWGAAGNRYTIAALTTLQNGAFRPDPVTGIMELMVRSGPQEGPAADPIQSNVYRKVGDAADHWPIGIPLTEMGNYHFQYRNARISKINQMLAPLKANPILLPRK